MRVIGYTRVSTAEQADSGAGLAAQRDAIEAEAARRGWELVELVEDAGSGRTVARPGLERALAACRSGEADGLVVAKLDRLTRSVVDFGRLLAEAQRGGWNLVALDFGLDLSTPQGELVANVLVSVSQWERRIIGARTRDALAVKRAQGVAIGRPRSLPEEVRETISSARASGMTLRAIAEMLTEQGVPTAHGGARWHPETVRKIAAGTAVAGMRTRRRVS